MNNVKPDGDHGRVIDFQERRLGKTVLRTHRTKIDIKDVYPNDRQPRRGGTEDEELQREIEANEGLFEDILVEPHPQLRGKLRIIDGERRWTNSRILVSQGREQFRLIPVEITDRTLNEDERLRLWVYIHRQRREWDAREKEMVAHRLVELVGRAGAANILGISVRELDKLVEIFELSQKFVGLRDQGAAIGWARELNSLSKKLLTPTVKEAVIRKVGQRRITNSKDLRKLRRILRDPIARDHFISEDGNLDSALLKIGPVVNKVEGGFVGELETAVEAMRRVPWTTLAELKGDPHTIKKIDEAEALLKALRKTLSS